MRNTYRCGVFISIIGIIPLKLYQHKYITMGNPIRILRLRGRLSTALKSHYNADKMKSSETIMLNL